MWRRNVAVATIDGPQLGPFLVEFVAGTSCREDEFRLRYDVFVEERHYLPEAQDLVKRERDEFDDQSVAFLLRDADTLEPAACQRFILPDRLPAGLTTQVERLAATSGLPFDPRPRREWAEVSRSTIAKKYRWGSSTAPMPAMRVFKYASLALAGALGRSTLFSVSDVRTAALTERRMGFQLHQIGAEFEYHGPRALFRIDLAEVQRSVPADLLDTLAALVVQARDAVVH